MESNKKKRSFWKIFFIVFGISFGVVCLLIAGLLAYVVIKKPFGINLLQFPGKNVDTTVEDQKNGESAYDHPLLNNSQEKILQNLGVDLQTIPTEITKEQLDCTTEALGADRARELFEGASPTISDFIKAQRCL